MLTTDPFALLSDLERQFEQTARPRAARTGWMPAADVIAADDEIRVIMDAPGVSREDLSVELADGRLVITGHRRPVDVTGSSAQRIERGWGRWSRAIELRDGLDFERSAASLVDGVLTITIPVAESAKPRRIEIGGESRAAAELES